VSARTDRDEALTLARALPIDPQRLRATVERLAGVGSSPLGFRTTGTPEDREVAEYAADAMRDCGLADVAIEEVTVDGWRFLGASLDAVGVPSPANPPTGCRFHPRCPHATDICRTDEPPLVPQRGADHLAACHHPRNVLQS
jgi:hypothetical protein